MINQLMNRICEDSGYEIKDNLIQNTKPMSIETAQQVEPLIALRWRFRICRVSGKTFDITKEGLLYTCRKALEN